MSQNVEREGYVCTSTVELVPIRYTYTKGIFNIVDSQFKLGQFMDWPFSAFIRFDWNKCKETTILAKTVPEYLYFFQIVKSIYTYYNIMLEVV